MARAVWCCLFVLASCGRVPLGAAYAVESIIAGVAAAGISRAAGGCIAVCVGGTYCDNDSGFCRPRPCYDACTAHEQCDLATQHCIATPPAEKLPALDDGRASSQPVKKIW